MSSNSTGMSSLSILRSLAVDALRISSCVTNQTSHLLRLTSKYHMNRFAHQLQRHRDKIQMR